MKKFFLLGVAGWALACGGQTTGAADAGDAGHTSDATLDVATDAPVLDAPNLPDVAPPPPDGGPQPPPPPDGGVPTSNVYTFAIDTIFLGEATRGGTVSNTAWQDYGYDIDGLTTTKSSTNVCTLAAGSPKMNQVDGTGGIDNAWGSVLLPILQTAASLPTPSTSESQIIDSGGWTLQLQVTGLSDDPQQSAVGLTSQLFMSGNYGSVPAFDSSTDWPVLSTSVVDGATIASGSTVQFASSYVSNGTFVSGPGTSAITLSFGFNGVAMPLTIHHAVFSFDHVDHADAALGTISGVLDTTEFIAALQKVAGEISVSLCGSAFDGIAAQIRQAQDILLDGTNAPNVACDGISIGLGFTAMLVANPTTVAPAPPPVPDPCGD